MAHDTQEKYGVGHLSRQFFQQIQIKPNGKEVSLPRFSATFNEINANKTVATWTVKFNESGISKRVSISDSHESIEGTSHIERVIAALKAEREYGVAFEEFPIAQKVTFLDLS